MKAVAILTSLFWTALAAAADIAPATVVRFNTVCAKCHEGECSGRLSFGADSTAADGHIRRYLGEVPAGERADYRGLLAHMKRSCAYYPLPPAPSAGRWDADALATLRTPENAYFVPLGRLAAGRHRLTLRFAGEAEFCAEVVSASFEIDDHPGQHAHAGIAAFEFIVAQAGEHFLRIQGGKSSAMVSLSLDPAR